MIKTHRRRSSGFTLAALALAALSGCVATTTYPARPGQDYAARDVSHPSIEEICVEALTWTLERYPVPEELAEPTSDGGVFAVNCPVGMHPRVYERVVEKCGPLARPLTPETEHLPTYHVGRIVVRSDKAEIDIHRPVLELGAVEQLSYQPITLFIEGGLGPWRVRRSRPWAIGAFPLPQANYFTPSDRLGRRIEPMPDRPPATDPGTGTPSEREAAPDDVPADMPADRPADAPADG
ncbi:MAG: hypothetical protein AAGI53_02855 [Planctomycetota bacterium]